MEKCGSCHTMADAGTKGTVGPNLDDAFDSDKKQGFDEQTIRDVVRGQIAYAETDPATGSPGMPQNIVTGSDADSVATYVAKCAAVAHCNVTAPGTPPPSGGGGGGGATTTTAGGGAGGKLAEGKRIFESAGCVSCHTLKDAGSHGAVGPNLDQAKPSKALAVTRVTNGKGVMPSFKGQLTPAQIDAVATYVSSVAGK